MRMPYGIEHNVPLAHRTTLGVGGNAEYFVRVTTTGMLEHVVRWAKTNGHQRTILAGGSNVLIMDEGVRGLVIQPDFQGVTYEDIDDARVRVRVGAGVVFDTLIAELVSRDMWGLENLSAIPGSVGATPIQNVGAYGVEVKDVIESVTVFDCDTYTTYEIKNSDCDFSYRDSRFKHDAKKKYIIVAVSFILSKIPHPQITYKDLAHFFAHSETPTLSDIRSAIISIRNKKFPDWRVLGTAGSFFKNPIITNSEYQQLVQKYRDIPAYVTQCGDVKIALGYVLDKVCGLKGYREGVVWLFEAQALVLVCEKGSRARDIFLFSEHVIEQVFQKTKIRIEREVTIM